LRFALCQESALAVTQKLQPPHEQEYAGAVADSDVNAIDCAPLPDYSEDGVDLSLIRWTLSLTPRERLQFLEERIDDILAIRALNAGR
jgi:hypothetical protein